MRTIGIDIGTTTICAVLLDAATGELLVSKTLANTTGIQTENKWEKIQNAGEILKICIKLIESIQSEADKIISIGVTGQMHGIVYLDKLGKPVTPLYTWQDARGNLIYKEEKSYSQYLSEVTGYRLAAGYGIVTHFYNEINQLLPKEAVVFCTIADYIAMKLGKEKTPILHPSMAASLGVYQLREGCFDSEALKKAEIEEKYLPKVSAEERGVLYKKASVPVALAFGDNQASFLGSVGEGSRLLVNVGTGSQISVLCSELQEEGKGEFRPYIKGSYLCVSSSLCGGYSYALLRNFFKEVLALFNCETTEEIYQKMNEAAKMVYGKAEQIKVSTQFNGTRENPEGRGGMMDVGTENYHPEYFILGTLQGICDELYHFYETMPKDILQEQWLSASGNGIRMNPLLQKIFEDTFKMNLRIPCYAEEASYGSALFSLYAVGYYKEPEELQRLIRCQ